MLSKFDMHSFYLDIIIKIIYYYKNNILFEVNYEKNNRNYINFNIDDFISWM